MAELNHRLKAATLLESLIAMIVVVVCIGIGTVIYSNVLGSDNERLKLKAVLLLEDAADKTKAAKAFIDAEEKEGDYTIRRTVTHYERTKSVYCLSLSLIREGKVIATRKELVIAE